MSTQQFVAHSLALSLALPLTLAGGVALAQQSLTTVEVRADSEMSLAIACDTPSKPPIREVDRVLGITDDSQSYLLRRKLMAAAAEACKAGEPKIQVTRGSDGQSLAWKPMK